MSFDVNWATCQELSDQILAEGLFVVSAQDSLQPEQVISDKPGNYMISLKAQPFYVGEAKNLMSRIRQQFVARTSTFYKTYAKRVDNPTPINAFRVRYIETAIGRKELSNCD